MTTAPAGDAFPNFTGELSVILGAAYESFLRARLERRAGRRGKVHARALVSFIEMVAEMIGEAGDGHDPDVLWKTA